MPVSVVRLLVVVELEGELDQAESLFGEFQESVEGGAARAVERASLGDLKDFAPAVVVIEPGLEDTHVAPAAAVDCYGDDDDPGDVGNPRYQSDGPELTPEEQAELDDYVTRDPPPATPSTLAAQSDATAAIFERWGASIDRVAAAAGLTVVRGEGAMASCVFLVLDTPADAAPQPMLTAVLAVVGTMSATGDVYTEAALRAAADGVTKFYDEGRMCLIYRGPIPTARDDPDPGA
jgi:hypothetical protein